MPLTDGDVKSMLEEAGIEGSRIYFEGESCNFYCIVLYLYSRQCLIYYRALSAIWTNPASLVHPKL